MRTSIKLGACILAAAFTMGSAVAQAQQLEHTDDTGDVVLRDQDSGQVTLEPDWPNGDITDLRVLHGPHRVKVRLGFDELSRNVDAIFHELDIRTPRRVYKAVVLTHEDGWRGDAELWLSTRQEKCAALEHDIDYAKNVVRVWVSRKCLGEPRWVQLGAGTSTLVEDEETEGVLSRWDEALRRGEGGKEPKNLTLTQRKLRSS